MSLTEVLEFTGLCRTAIYQLEKSDDFPSRVSIGKRSVPRGSTDRLERVAPAKGCRMIPHREAVDLGEGSTAFKNTLSAR